MPATVDTKTGDYFFVALSNRFNLDLCLDFDIAGFPEGPGGVLPFCDIEVGDYLSFLFGARVYNLYRVKHKEAVLNPESLPPDWKPIVAKDGQQKYFPFRLSLSRIKEFEDSIAKDTYATIAENLLRRGGYGKSYFQADGYTLGGVERLEEGKKTPRNQLDVPPHKAFEPKFKVGGKGNQIYSFNEGILQTLIRKWLQNNRNRSNLLQSLGLDSALQSEVEVVGERALQEGYVDLTIQESTLRQPKLIIIEVKLGKASERDYEQLARYTNQLGNRCLGGLMIAKSHYGPSPHGKRASSIAYGFRHQDQFALGFDDLLKQLIITAC